MASKNIIVRIGTKGAKPTLRVLKNVSGGLFDIGKKATLVGAGFSALSAKLAGDFQKNLLEISTLLKGSPESIDASLKEVSNSLLSASSASGLALESLSKAQYDIISAGFGNASDSAILLNQSMKLAVGGVTSAANAADVLTSAINAFGGTSADAQRISDALFVTVQQGKTTLSELGGSLGLVLPFAKSFGLSIEGVGSAMATLTAGGISTAESVTALKGAINALESPAKRAKEAMGSAGIEVVRFDDGTVDLVKTIEQFKDIDPDLMKKFIPNVQGALAIKTLANNITSLENNVKAFADASKQELPPTETAFQKMQEGINTQMSMLKNNFQSVLIVIGKAINEKLEPVVKAINKEFQRLNDIGFDNLATSIKDNIPLILKTLVDAFKEAFNMIELQAGLFSRIIMDKLMFRDNKTLHKELQDALNKSFEFRTKEIAKSFTNMYGKITGDAKEASDKQKQENQKVIKSQELRTESLKTEVPEIQKKIEFITIEEEARRKHARSVEEQIKALISAGVSQTEADEFRTEQMLNFERKIRASKQESVSSLIGELGKLNQASKGSALVSKRLAQVQAIIDTFAGANKALASSAPPFNFISASAVIATGLANVATIESQKFASGGIVQGDPTKGDSVPAMLTAGELILNQAQQDNLAGQMGNITVNVSAPLVDETVIDSIIPALDRARQMELA